MLEHDLVSTSQFLPLIRAHVPECPSPIMEAQLLAVLQDFCEHTAYWQEKLPEVLTLDGITSYQLETSAGTAMVKVIEVATSDGDKLTMRSNPGSTEKWWWQSRPDVLEIYDEAGEQFLSITAALKPTGTDVSSTIYTDYRHEIQQGTLARLYAMPNKPWSAPDLYRLAQDDYINGRNQAARKAGRGFATLPRRPQPKARNFF